MPIRMTVAALDTASPRTAARVSAAFLAVDRTGVRVTAAAVTLAPVPAVRVTAADILTTAA